MEWVYSHRLQSVLNISVRSIAGLHRSAHSTDALASFHCLRAVERIKFKRAVIVYRALHCTSISVRHAETRCRHPSCSRAHARFRSLTSSHLVVRPLRLVTIGERSFASAGPNSLPDNITTAQSLPAFQRKLKTSLFRQSYPDIIL